MAGEEAIMWLFIIKQQTAVMLYMILYLDLIYILIQAEYIFPIYMKQPLV